MHETRILGHTSAPVWLGERILTASCCNCWGDCWFKTCFADQNSFGSRLKSSCHGLLFPLMDDDPSTSEPIADGQFNLVLCVVSSAVAGIGIGLFGCLLSCSWSHEAKEFWSAHQYRPHVPNMRHLWFHRLRSGFLGGFNLRLGESCHSGASWQHLALECNF